MRRVMDSNCCRTGVHTYAELFYCYRVGVCACVCARGSGRKRGAASPAAARRDGHEPPPPPPPIP